MYAYMYIYIYIYVPHMRVCLHSVLKMLVEEAKEAISKLMLNCGEFCEYLEFWNLVDWAFVETL